MSIYKENKFSYNRNRKINFDFSKYKKPLIISLIILVLIIGIFLIITKVNWNKMFEKPNIYAKFDKNPLHVSKANNSMLSITITNNSSIDATNSIVSLKPIENKFNVFCNNSIDKNKSTILIPMIAKNNKRIISCDVRAKDTSKLLEGTYSFNIDFNLNNKIYNKRIKLDVRN